MSFTREQVDQLLKPIALRRVLKDPRGKSHVSQQDVLAHLTRVFGFGGFDIAVLDVALVFEQEHVSAETGKVVPGRWDVCYKALVALTVKDPDGFQVAHYENGSTATGQNLSRGDAHDLAYKGLALDTEIATPTGWATMGDLAPGDTVFDRDGQPVRVMGTSEVKHLDCYRVTFRNGHSIVCDAEHLWVATIAQETEKVHPIGALHAAKAAGKRVVIPVTEPLVTERRDLPLDPWVLGYWLGNGSRSGARVTCHGDDTDAVIAAITSAGYLVGSVRPERGNAATIGIRGIRKTLAEMGALGTKYVPRDYLRGSIEQRRGLLAGLMDSDGSADSRSGRVTFINTDRHLVDVVLELGRSLGEHMSVTKVEGFGYGQPVTSWSVQWRPTAVPFALPRKAAKVSLRSKIARNIVASIDRVESVPTRCISVDSPTRTFLAGRDLVPTHNSAISLSVKRAAIALGDQFGLSLYNKGQTSALVIASLVMPEGEEPEESEDLQADVPQQVSLGNDEIDREEPVNGGLLTHPPTIQQAIAAKAVPNDETWQRQRERVER